MFMLCARVSIRSSDDYRQITIELSFFISTPHLLSHRLTDRAEPPLVRVHTDGKTVAAARRFLHQSSRLRTPRSDFKGQGTVNELYISSVVWRYLSGAALSVFRYCTHIIHDS